MIWEVLMPPSQTGMHLATIGIINGFISAKHGIGQIGACIDAQVPLVVYGNLVGSEYRKSQIEFAKEEISTDALTWF